MLSGKKRRKRKERKEGKEGRKEGREGGREGGKERKEERKKGYVVLAGWLSWLAHGPVQQKDEGLITGQGIYLGC